MFSWRARPGAFQRFATAWPKRMRAWPDSTKRSAVARRCEADAATSPHLLPAASGSMVERSGIRFRCGG
jgi:hypothetical protein